MRANDDGVLALVHGDLCDGGISRLAHGFEQKVIRLLAGFFGDHEIRRIVIDGVDAVGFDEFRDLHGVAGSGRDGFDLFVVDDDVAVFLYFEAFDQFAAFDHAIALGAEGLLFDSAATNVVNLVKADAFGARGGEETNGDGDEPERDEALPNC